MPLTRAYMSRLFARLNDDLARQDITGELYLVGGAVMCLVFDARTSTRGVDGFFRPSGVIRTAARRIAAEEGLADDWLNDAVQGYLSPRGDFKPFLDLSNLRVLTAAPEYLLAMKCLAMRLGEEFHDEQDLRFLLRWLNVTDYGQALMIVARFYPLEGVPQKTLYALEEILQQPAS